MSPIPTCPLCETLEPRAIGELRSDEIARFWLDRHDIDVTSELDGTPLFRIFACRRCALRWVLPPVSGSGDFYARLEGVSWYYMEDKWEHREALADLPERARVLEVGAGNGHFVAMADDAGLDARGIELNASAAAHAREKGLRVDAMDLAELARDEPDGYDAVCAFQVLEHVPEPSNFLKQMCRVIRPGGLLIVSVPNLDSFLRHAEMDPMNMPPHHLTHWTPETFGALAKELGLELVRLAYEPLATYHVGWFLSVHCGRLPAVPFLRGALRRFLGLTAGPLLEKTRLRCFLRGHTMYGAFRVKG